MASHGSSVIKASACNAEGLGSIPGLEVSLEKEMATHSSIFDWRISWTKEPGRLHSSSDHKSWTQLSAIFLSFLGLGVFHFFFFQTFKVEI